MPSHVRIIIRSKSGELLKEILRGEDVDLNCGGPKKNQRGEWELEIYGPPALATRLKKSGAEVEVDGDYLKRMAARQREVGSGDRFQGGRSVPRGVGRKE